MTVESMALRMCRQRGYHVALTCCILLVGLLLLVASCAKQGFPGGGPRDVAPPMPLQFAPQVATTHFAEKGFTIEFDEYFTLKDADRNVLVSPPLSSKPRYTTRGRKLLVRWDDTLRSETTYLFQFRDVIADYNEGNLLPALDYVFCTGANLDTLTLTGRVVDAFTGEPSKEKLSVMLFDSLPTLDDTTAEARYVSRCDADGAYAFRYVREGRYVVVAVDDANRNGRPDLGETVAFDTTYYVPQAATDSAALEARRVRLCTWSTKAEKQRVAGADFVRQGYAVVATVSPMEAPTVQLNNEACTWLLSAQRDTLRIWLHSREVDSLVVMLHDTTGLADTLRLRFRAPAAASASSSHFGVRSAAPKTATLISSNARPQFPYYDTLWLQFTNPIAHVAEGVDTMMTLLKMSDTSAVAVGLQWDTATMLRARVVADMRAGEDYKLTVAAGAFADLWGNSNDSLIASLALTAQEAYGSVAIEVDMQQWQRDGRALQCIVLLTDEKGKTLRSQLLQHKGRVHFPHLEPAKYGVRVVEDSDGDGHWTAGDFDLRRQPEATFRFDKMLDVRANWDFEEQWTVPNAPHTNAP